MQDRRTVVFVTHDIDEALALSGRVLVMSPRPGRIFDRFDVPFTRPRSVRATGDASLAELRIALLRTLERGVEPAGGAPNGGTGPGDEPASGRSAP